MPKQTHTTTMTDTTDRVAEIEARRAQTTLPKTTLALAIGRDDRYWIRATSSTADVTIPDETLDAAEAAVEYTEGHGYPPEPGEVHDGE